MIFLIFLKCLHFSVAFVHIGSSSETVNRIDQLFDVIEGMKMKMAILEADISKLKVMIL